MKLNIVFKQGPGVVEWGSREVKRDLIFVGITDDAGTPIEAEAIGAEWIADGDHEALVIDTERFR